MKYLSTMLLIAAALLLTSCTQTQHSPKYKHDRNSCDYLKYKIAGNTGSINQNTENLPTTKAQDLKRYQALGCRE